MQQIDERSTGARAEAGRGFIQDQDAGVHGSDHGDGDTFLFTDDKAAQETVFLSLERIGYEAETPDPQRRVHRFLSSSEQILIIDADDPTSHATASNFQYDEIVYFALRTTSNLEKINYSYSY